MRRIAKSITAVLLLWAATARGDHGPEIVWQLTFGGTDDDGFNAVVALPDGGLAAAGWSEARGGGPNNLWVLRTAGDGRPLWERFFGGAKSDYALDIVRMADGGFAVVGATSSKGAGESDVWVLRLDAAGGLIWDRTFGGPADDYASGAVALADGGLAVVGTTGSKGAGGRDLWVLRLDGSGGLVWDRTFGGRADDAGYRIAAPPSGGFAIAGSTRSKGAGEDDAWVLRLGGDGRLVWDRTFGGKDEDEAFGIVALGDGGFVVSGTTASNEPWGAWVLRLDGNGTLLWDRAYGDEGPWFGGPIAALPDGGLALVGEDEFVSGVLRLDRDGRVLWDYVFDEFAWMSGIAAVADGLALAGSAFTQGAAIDGWLVRLAEGQRTAASGSRPHRARPRATRENAEAAIRRHATAAVAGPKRAQRPAAVGARPPLDADAILRSLAPIEYLPGQGGAARARSVELEIQFKVNSAELSDEAGRQLEQLAAALGNPRLAATRFAVVGHTDSSGSAAANKALSLGRAETVKRFLVARRIGADRIDTAGLGSERPKDPINPTSPANRRVEIIALDAATAVPGRAAPAPPSGDPVKDILLGR